MPQLYCPCAIGETRRLLVTSRPAPHSRALKSSPRDRAREGEYTRKFEEGERRGSLRAGAAPLSPLKGTVND